MTASARLDAVAASASARRGTQQRAALFVSMFLYVLVVSVLSGLWRAAARANHGAIAGYSAVAITWYIAASEAVTISMNSRLIADIGADIIGGEIAVEMLRPASVLRVRVATQLGAVAPRLAACAVGGVVLSTALGGRPPNATALLLAVPSLALAVACNVVAQHAFAAAAFWLRETGATWFLYQKLVFMLGGMLIPLEVLPSWLHRAALATPFPAMAYMPARIASGHVEPTLLLAQGAWLVVLSIVAAAMFGAGERRLQVVGG